MKSRLAVLVAALAFAAPAHAHLVRHAKEPVAHFHARLFHHGVTWERWARHHRRLYPSGRRFRHALRDARWLQRRYRPIVVVAPSSFATASWYGPGFYGNRTACGEVLSTSLVGVAHRWLACGTRLLVCYSGRCSEATVVDRGPFVAGREFDLTGALAWRLGFGGVGTISYRVL
jgi:rare lipoprotein A (peptidoglycan hydrolase)